MTRRARPVTSRARQTCTPRWKWFVTGCSLCHQDSGPRRLPRRPLFFLMIERPPDHQRLAQHDAGSSLERDELRSNRPLIPFVPAEELVNLSQLRPHPEEPERSEGVSKDGRESELAAMVRDGAPARASSP